MIKIGFFSYAIVVFLIKLTVQNCNKGCLKCLTAETCFLCDHQNGYFLIDQQCRQKELKNCLKYDLTGNCTKCNMGYYLNEVFQCEQILDSSKIENCEEYVTMFQCQKCKQGFNLEESKCIQRENYIENCQNYNQEDATLCDKCIKGYRLNQEKKLCTIIEIKNNCLVSSLLKCQKCKNGYFLNRNQYFKDVFNFSDYEKRNLLFDIWVNSFQSPFTTYRFQQCQQIHIENCLQYDTQNIQKCVKCQMGYYLLEDNTCAKKPLQPIKNCVKYLDLQNCIQCEPKYFLESSLKCTIVLEIENCLFYDNSANKSVCQQCKPGLFFDGSVCMNRIDSLNIENCIQYSQNSDQCQICQDNYILSSDKIQCQLGVVNCIQYNGLVCQKCKEGFYLDQQNNICLAGTIPNCQLYEANTNKCTKCQNGYFFQDSFCLKHKFYPECNIFSQTIQDYCDKCSQPHIKFLTKNTCIPQPYIMNCEQVDSSNQVLTCLKCKNGYVLDENQKCILSTNEYCLKQQSGICIECLTEYMLMPLTMKCVQPQQYYSKYCKNIEKLSINEFKCNSCKDNAYPFQMPNFDSCIESSEKFFQKIQFCDRYKKVGDNYECYECSWPLVFDSSTKTCQTSCSNTQLIIQLNIQNQVSQKLQKNECKTIANFETCQKLMLISESTTQSHICISCKNDTKTSTPLPFVDKAQQSLNSHIAFSYQTQNNKLYFHPSFKSYGVQCGNHTTTDLVFFNQKDNTSPVANCQLYTQVTLVDSVDQSTYTLYKCIQCAHGMTGIIGQDLDQEGYISSCVDKIQYCDENSEIKNLLNPKNGNIGTNYEPLQFYSSCSKCLGDRLPVILLKENSLSYYTLQSYTNVDQTQGKFQFCKLNDKQYFEGYENLTIFDSIVANCGYILQIISDTPSADISQLGALTLKCAACKPNYKPVYTSEVITECQLIENCEQYSFQDPKFFNGCPVCKEGFQHYFDNNTKQVDYTKCVIQQDTNCMYFNDIDSKCIICKKGYFLNIDEQCEKISVPLCQENQFIQSQTPFNQNLNLAIYQALQGHGCTFCEGESSKFVLNQPICVQSEYLKSIQNTSKFIFNCLYYDSNTTSPIKCSQCQSGFVLSDTKLECYSASSLQNCSLATSINTCIQCETNFVLRKGACESPNITNCQTYVQNADPQMCQKCNTGYFLDQNICQQGSIQNCKNYTSSINCTQCDQNYQLISTKGGSYCYPIPNGSNCKQYDTSFSSFELSCKECNEGFVISQNKDDFEITQCLKIQTISQCKLYDINSSFQDSTLQCIQCNDDYYYKNEVCNKRQHQDIFCLQYHLYEDKCIQCQSHHFLSTDQKTCESFPNGIFQCMDYKNNQTCKFCNQGYFLQENKCVELNQENQIQDCYAYGNDQKCIRCNSGFFLKDNTCVTIVAQNCLEVTDENTCSSCVSSEYGIKKEGDVTNCIIKNLPNCEQSTNQDPFECISCLPSYYLDENKQCVSVNQKIENCLYYNTDQNCMVCDIGYLLKPDKKTCEVIDQTVYKSLEQNCISFVEEEKANCEICEFGYFFDDNGECQRCVENTIDDGCLSCNPNNTKECYLCSSGFYQSSHNANCLSIFEQTQQENIEEKTQNLKILIILLMIIN